MVNLLCVIHREFRFWRRRDDYKEIIDYIIYAKEKGCSMQGMQDPAVESLFVLTGENIDRGRKEWNYGFRITIQKK